jgi:hypothetical protein
MKPMKAIAYCCLVVSSLVVLAWPLIFFGSIFLFDAPTRGALYEFRRWTGFFLAVSYPWAYIVALVRIWLLKTNAQEWWTKKLTIVFLLAPIAQVGLAFLITN